MRLTIEIAGDMTPTIGSHALLLRLGTNLLHNAIVHNLPARGTVWVTTSSNSRYVALTVENTGEPLTPQVVSMLIEPFLRGTARIATDHAGIGLDLALINRIAQAHDGHTHPHPPRRRGALRHGATPRRAIAHRRVTTWGKPPAAQGTLPGL